MKRLKIAFYTAGGCGGCDMSVIDMSESFLNFTEKFEIVFWTPMITDLKYRDIEKIPSDYIDFGFFSGNLNTKEHEKIAKLMRDKCRKLITLGICASEGGIRGLANLHTPEQLIKTAYIETISNDSSDKITPKTGLPSIKKVKTLNQVVNVDYFIGGCPPHHEHMKRVFHLILKDELPPSGSWITDGKSVCELCDKNSMLKGKPREALKEIKRLYEGTPESDRCLLEQGYLCLGPLTLGDCGCRCPSVNIPCAGCGGAVSGVSDFGLRAISMIAGIVEREELIQKIPAPVFLFYRYTLASFLNKLSGRK
uniref:F420-nonreducing hydrogenase n=1 Tax=Thermodesulfovibrio aggregans TaxID=86166 RepID=A0A7C4AIZ9_9BACT